MPWRGRMICEVTGQVYRRVCETACELNSPDIVSDRPSSSPIRRFPGIIRIVAYARSVSETSRDLNSPDVDSARPYSSPVSRSPGFLPIVAYADSEF